MQKILPHQLTEGNEDESHANNLIGLSVYDSNYFANDIFCYFLLSKHYKLVYQFTIFNMTSIEYYHYFKKDFDLLSDEELISRFNQGVGLRAYCVARQGYLLALRTALDEHEIDYSAVGDKQSLRFDKHVCLMDKRMLVI